MLNMLALAILGLAILGLAIFGFEHVGLSDFGLSDFELSDFYPMDIRNERQAENQITTREYVTYLQDNRGSSCGLRGPLALLAL